MLRKVTVIGGGLAGAEAAFQLTKRGIGVDLYEMRPVKSTGAHTTGNLAELVCSNSLGSDNISSASGLLKQEMRILGSELLKFAQVAAVPAGNALAVDRVVFGEKVTAAIRQNPLINLITEEVTAIPTDTPVIIASGPLTSGVLAQEIKSFTGEEHLHFFDAIAPIIERDSIDFNKAFYADRYGKGENSYINCPMNREEYENFYEKLINAELIELKSFEKGAKFFESCLPVEVLAKRGKDTLRFGPMKPVGLNHPETGEKYYAVVQLRQDNKAETLYNMVGFQTNMKWGAQKEVIKSIPGLENAEITRFGVMHRNTFVNSPKFLKPTLQTVRRDDLFFAGQITGVEGYTESIAMGLLAGINAAKLINNEDLLMLEPKSMLGALCNYITFPEHKHFQPVNSNWGILEPLTTTPGKNKDLKKQLLAERALLYTQNLGVHYGAEEFARSEHSY